MKWSFRTAILLILFLLGSGIAFAHASLQRASPAPGAVLDQPPAQVQLWFDEQIEPRFSEVQVLDAGRVRMDAAPAQLALGDAKSLVVPLKPLARGSYSVVWKVLSATDGHITRGIYGFSVGAPGTVAAQDASEPPNGASELTPAAAAARGLSLLSLLVLVGGFLFQPLLLGPSAGTADGEWPQREIEGRLRRLSAAALTVALLANGWELALQANLVADRLSLESIGAVLLGTRYGALWLSRMALLLALAALNLIRNWTSSRILWLLTAAGALALLTRSLGSHGAAAQGDVSLAVLSDWLHLLGISLWVGGLAQFGWLLPFLWPRLAPGTRGRWLARFVARFSAAALGATVLIALTGIYNSTLQLPSLDSLFGSGYGATLLFKLILFALMLSLGAVNLLVIGPRLRGGRPEPQQAARLAARLRLTLTIEIALGIAAIFAAALLTIQPPVRARLSPAAPTAAPPAPILLSGELAPGVSVQLLIGPGRAGASRFEARVVAADGRPTSNILRVMLDFTLLDSETGSQSVAAQPTGDGHYVVDNRPLPLGGLWRIRVIVRRQGVEDVSVDFPFYVGDLPVSAAADEPAARALLAAAETRMNALNSLRSTQYLNDGVNGVQETAFEFRAPDRMRFTTKGQGSSIAIGPVQYFQDQSGAWAGQGRVEPYVFPRFGLSKQAQQVTLGRSDNAANGEPSQIVRFALPTSSGPPIEYAYWISSRDQHVLQYAMVAEAHYMFEYYRDPDAADISIQAPVVATAPVASATPNPAIAAAPLTGARRMRGLITGDLEGDGALLLLVAGIAAGALGLGRRLSRHLRLTALGLAAACILAGLGLFIDAANATTAGVGSVSVDPQLAAAGRANYEEYCQGCHGPTGKGDGPAGAALPVKPFDLTTHVLLHDEFYLQAVILNGRGYMPAFGDRLSQEQILQLVAYIRQLALEARQNRP